ncbi:Virulence factor Mce family protein Precursor [Streptomyces sp. CNQ-509]|uniref:MCE family protein n=1 Tax=Streptomyces sp. CNQ-509 TaxID=444103 RepID=UPI00062DE909|nr:MCE family protein [Streptomyces sp. CNQ-509]AKH82913.1 Virulence factor Mce family protein Precursor [Streptomyces sp. CNQ-509]
MNWHVKTVAGVVAAALVIASPLVVREVYESADVEFTGIQDLPLPGGADLGSHPYEVTAEFEDVLSLVPQSSVRVNDVAVGRVTDIEVADDRWTAVVTMKVNGDVRLPAGAYARIEQSSLLGEKYVQLLAPPGKKQADAEQAGDLGTAPGDVTTAILPDDGGTDIPLARTNRNPQVEEVFGALSMLLNGGGIEQLRTISRELNDALQGNEPQVRSMLKRVDTLMTSLDDNKDGITDALDSVNRLSATLATRKTEIGVILDDLSPGMKVLEEQRGALVTMLRSLDRLSDVAVETIDASKEDMIADLRALGKVLKNLADAGQALPASLEVLLTYPFTDEVLRGVKGDYLNIYLAVTAPSGTELIPPLTEDPVPGSGDPGGAPTGTALSLPLPSVGPTTPGAGPPASPDPGGPAPDGTGPRDPGSASPGGGPSDGAGIPSGSPPGSPSATEPESPPASGSESPGGESR